MSDLQQQFETAAADVQKLPKRPNDKTLLKLYALYKQATSGDVAGSRPGGFDFAARAKYDAWVAVKGTPKDKAMQDYIALVEQLKS